MWSGESALGISCTDIELELIVFEYVSAASDPDSVIAAKNPMLRIVADNRILFPRKSPIQSKLPAKRRVGEFQQI
jgi:hypothetical protein